MTDSDILLPLIVVGPVVVGLCGAIGFLVSWIRSDRVAELDARERHASELNEALKQTATAHAQMVAFCAALKESNDRLTAKIEDALKRIGP